MIIRELVNIHYTPGSYEKLDRRISVFTALYNHEDYVQECLESALNQTMSPFEILVIDDASTDNSLEIVRSYDNPLVKIISEKNNYGGASTSNAIKKCTGEFVAILNSDDVWAPEKLKTQYDCITATPDIGAVFTHVRTIDETGNAWPYPKINQQKAFNVKDRTRHEWLNHLFLFGNPFCASSAMVRRECLERSGTFDGGYIQLQDFDMWTRIALDGYGIRVLEEPLTHYRVMRNGSNMSSGQSGARATNTFEYAKILRNYWCVSTLDELLKIFPNIRVADSADDRLILYYLARYAAELPSIHHKLFALETMSKWGGDRSAMDVAYKCHGFDFTQYREFFTRGPIRTLCRLTWRHNLHSLAFKVLPPSIYQRLKSLLSK